ncbi:MAG: Fic family protein [Pseudonocardiaceae bacterium]
MAGGASPAVLAAWVHHRFTQIHPFRDGNGRRQFPRKVAMGGTSARCNSPSLIVTDSHFSA